MQTQMTSRSGELAGFGRTKAARADGERWNYEGTEGAPSPVKAERRAMRLGWLSIGLGLSQLFAPAAIDRLIGVRAGAKQRTTTLTIGARELMCGLGILALPRASGFLWARVAGDIMDLTLLGRALNARRSDKGRVMTSIVAVSGVLLADTVAAIQLQRSRGGRSVKRSSWRDGIHVTKSITVNRPPEEVYAFWRDFENLPEFMAHLESVKVTDGRSHWRAKGPAGLIVEWEAIVMTDRPNEIIGWQSLDGTGTISHAGTVRFAPAPGNRGTEIHVELMYRAPGRKLGAAIAKLFGEEPSQQIESDLRRFKQVMETGTVVHSDASIHHGPHAARPSENGKNDDKKGYFR